MKWIKQIICLLLLLQLAICLLCPPPGRTFLRVQELSLVDMPTQIAVKEVPMP